MSDAEKWVKAYEKLKKEGMLAPAADYEELFAKSEFQGKKLFLFSMGTVTFPTGKIIVCDPLVYLDKHCAVQGESSCRNVHAGNTGGRNGRRKFPLHCHTDPFR